MTTFLAWAFIFAVPLFLIGYNWLFRKCEWYGKPIAVAVPVIVACGLFGAIQVLLNLPA